MRSRIVLGGLAALIVGGVLTIFVLSRSNTARVTGVVTGPQGPIAGATVVAMLHPKGGGTIIAFPVVYPLRWEAMTDSNGRYEFPHIRTDTEVWIGVVVPGKGVPMWASPRLKPGEALELALQMPTFTPAPTPNPR